MWDQPWANCARLKSMIKKECCKVTDKKTPNASWAFQMLLLCPTAVLLPARVPGFNQVQVAVFPPLTDWRFSFREKSGLAESVARWGPTRVSEVLNANRKISTSVRQFGTSTAAVAV